jgi:hypothetical protein
MSLTSDRDLEPFFDRKLQGVGFQMKANGAAKPIRIIVTCHALADMQRTEFMNASAALACFRTFRDRIEAAAVAKLARVGVSSSEYEGLPTVLLMTGDPI